MPSLFFHCTPGSAGKIFCATACLFEWRHRFRPVWFAGWRRGRWLLSGFSPLHGSQASWCPFITLSSADVCFAVHGNWAEWSDWGDCTVTCGGGQRRRFRTCSNPAPKHHGRPCIGNSQVTETCSEQRCAGQESNIFIHFFCDFQKIIFLVISLNCSAGLAVFICLRSNSKIHENGNLANLQSFSLFCHSCTWLVSFAFKCATAARSNLCT